ncbi:hypothetical protein UQ17_24745, partial [Escherichia coli]
GGGCGGSEGCGEGGWVEGVGREGVVCGGGGRGGGGGVRVGVCFLFESTDGMRGAQECRGLGDV